LPHPIHTGVGFLGEELVDVLEKEGGVEGRQVFEPNVAVLDVATGDLPRHHAAPQGTW
jgi:hypothetical protein